MNRVVAFAILLFVVVFATGARADNDARTHFNEGMRLLGKNDYDGACAEFEKSEKAAKPTMATSYQLGRCNEGREKYGLAFVYYQKAALLGDQTGDPERATIARQRAQEVSQKAPKLTIWVGDRRVDGMSIELDGETIDDEDWGKPLPVAETSHRIVVKAPGKKSATLQVPAPETGKVIKVEVPRLAAGSGDGGNGGAKVQPPSPAPQPGGSGPPPPGYAVPPGYAGPDQMKRRNVGLFATGIVFVCLGGVGIIGGALWLAGASVAQDDIPPGGVGLLISGVALMAVGIPFIVVFGKKVPAQEPAQKSSLRLEVIATPAGAALRGTF